MKFEHYPPEQGLYNPANEKDSCGIGFIAHIKGERSHKIIQDGIKALVNLIHRGACGCEANTGDGAGLLIQTPHEFFKKECDRLGIRLPEPGEYGVGVVFLPRDRQKREGCIDLLEKIAVQEGQTVLGWRDVPSDNGLLGDSAKAGEPPIRHIFIGRSSDLEDRQAFERKLYVIRKLAEHEAAKEKLSNYKTFYIPSMSSRTLIYKGMLNADQIESYYPDLNDPTMKTAIALVHSRFSTNTFPSWDLAQPFRYLCHNGEINTLRGNINWMRAREGMFESSLFGEDIKRILPIIIEGTSDSATFDMAMELLVLSGRPISKVMMMMIPEAWENHQTMPQEKKNFYEYHASMMEPWDGPASIAFSDGRVVGAVLDRNGLRPSRYYVTKDDLCIMASEVGVIDIDPANVAIKGRLQPGRMFLIDTEEGRIISDSELKHRYASEKPYGEWLEEQQTHIGALPDGPCPGRAQGKALLTKQQAFGYTLEDLEILIKPMVTDGKEPLGSMGNDAPLAVLSDRSQPLFNYFKQLFAQVTNPPLDALREEIVTSVFTGLGSEQNLLEPGPEHCRQIKLPAPILTNGSMAKLAHLNTEGFHSKTLQMLFPAGSGGEGMAKALDDLFEQADRAIADGCEILILSDRGVSREMAAIPSLLACSGLHHHLVRNGTRTGIGLVIESGEPRECHHFCMLIGYGAGAINPYLAFDSIHSMHADGMFPPDLEVKQAEKNYTKALVKGIVKVMSKMGISTVQSYRGAQIFEAIGLNRDFVDKYFTRTATQVQGIGIEEVAKEVELRHRAAYPARENAETSHVDWGGYYKWRQRGEFHQINPDMIAMVQHATATENYELFKQYTAKVNDVSKKMATLRGLFELKKAEKPIPIEEVEPVEAIIRRFATGAMSLGSISREAHETLAIAMNRLGGRSNTGEGGEDPVRFKPDANGDLRRSSVKQVASGRFGVTSHYLVNADELQIKIAQGAKPGEGGQLPGHKVSKYIASVRHSTPGVGLISPPPHHDIYSIEDLAQLIYDLKNANRHARICVKLVSEIGVGTVAAGVSKAHSDVVLISGHDGGTGASPLTSIKHAGTAWELGLSETQQTLVLNNLRDRIIVQTDGQLKTGRDVIVAALLGAEEFGFATVPLIVLGCIMMRACHKNTCPVGIATQDERLRERFAGKPEHVVTFFRFLAQEVRELLAELGFRTLDEIIGRSNLLEQKKAIDHWKARGLDLSKIFYWPEMPDSVARRRVARQDHGIDKVLDNTLLEKAAPALENGTQVEFRMGIKNTDRTVGAILGSEISLKYGEKGLPEDTIKIRFDGSAGQSFGAFVPKGMTLILEGDANDYVGKGLSGGKLVIYPPHASTFAAEENIIAGNVMFYGATSGEAFIRGVVGERFCVRNSGVQAVVEGTGDHCCEYMTGGRVIVIGRTGRNFAAGMSGGLAYVFDEDGDFMIRCNTEMVSVEWLKEEEDLKYVRSMLERHITMTGSVPGRRILDRWEDSVKKFRKVFPNDYKRALEEMKRAEEERNQAAATEEKETSEAH